MRVWKSVATAVALAALAAGCTSTAALQAAPTSARTSTTSPATYVTPAPTTPARTTEPPATQAPTDTGSPATTSQSGTRPAPATTGDPHRGLAVREIANLITLVPVMPGALAVHSSPAPVLAIDSGVDPTGFLQDDPNLVLDYLWWTVPVKPTVVIAWMKTHPPHGWIVQDAGSTSGPPFPTIRSLFESPSAPLPGQAAFGAPAITVSIIAFGSGSAVRIDAETNWIPTRDPASFVAATVSSVDVTVFRGGAEPTVKKTLTGAAARALALAFNLATPEIPALRSCADDVGFTDTLVFHMATSTITAVADIGGCFDMTVTVGKRRTTLLQTGSVNDVVLHELKLNGAYGQCGAG